MINGTHRLGTSLFIAALGIMGLACGLVTTPTLDVYDIERGFSGTGTIFIWAVTNGDEELASSLLSTKAHTAVVQYCQDGKVIACFDPTWLQNWSGVQNIIFRPSDSTGSIAAFQVGTETGDRASWIVLEEMQENGQWRIDGWRGLIDGRGEIPAGLVDGSNTTNQFPPSE